MKALAWARKVLIISVIAVAFSIVMNLVVRKIDNPLLTHISELVSVICAFAMLASYAACIAARVASWIVYWFGRKRS